MRPGGINVEGLGGKTTLSPIVITETDLTGALRDDVKEIANARLAAGHNRLTLSLGGLRKRQRHAHGPRIVAPQRITVRQRNCVSRFRVRETDHPHGYVMRIQITPLLPGVSLILIGEELQGMPAAQHYYMRREYGVQIGSPQACVKHHAIDAEFLALLLENDFRCQPAEVVGKHLPQRSGEIPSRNTHDRHHAASHHTPGDEPVLGQPLNGISGGKAKERHQFAHESPVDDKLGHHIGQQHQAAGQECRSAQPPCRPAQPPFTHQQYESDDASPEPKERDSPLGLPKIFHDQSITEMEVSLNNGGGILPKLHRQIMPGDPAQDEEERQR